MNNLNGYPLLSITIPLHEWTREQWILCSTILLIRIYDYCRFNVVEIFEVYEKLGKEISEGKLMCFCGIDDWGVE
jgi:hypothetical protein